MALYDVQYVMHNVNGLPEDDVVKTLHFNSYAEEDASPATALSLAGAVAAAHFDAADGVEELEQYISPLISRVNRPTIKVYDGTAPGSPLAVATQAGMHAAANPTGLPGEVALCLSFRGNYGIDLEDAPDDGDADLDPERPRSRKRGRVFEGPFNIAAINSATPHPPITALRLALLNFGQRLFDISLLGWAVPIDLKWVVVSKASGDTVVNDVSEAHVDNAWDTQRRRGLAPTGRSSLVF